MPRVIFWSLSALLAAAAAAQADEFVVTPGGANKVVFVSKATVESFQGRTNQITGSIRLDPASLDDSVTVHVEVDLGSLDTGIAMRNRHMRANHLETAKYPKAVFDGATVLGPASAKLEAGKPVTFDIEGLFSLHGVSHRLRTNVQVQLDAPGGKRQLHFETSFPVALSDYAISRPQFLFMKLANEQAVKVTGVANAE